MNRQASLGAASYGRARQCPARQRHRQVWWRRRNRVLVGQRSPGPVREALKQGLRAAAPLPRCSSDDWMSDPPTVEFPVPLRHTSPSEALRGSYELDCPIYASLAKEFGYDIVRGFDFTTGLVPA